MNVEPKEFINNVVKAYAKTKLTPKTGRMFQQVGGNDCCCPMGVLYCEENGIPNHNTSNYTVDEPVNLGIWEWAKNKFGEEFVTSFWKGFDGCPWGVVDREVYDLAREVNQKVFTLYRNGELYG